MQKYYRDTVMEAKRVTLSRLYADLPLGIFEFVIRVDTQLDLPSFKGSTFRGGFGAAFRRVACHNRQHKYCRECISAQCCPYAYIFETPASESPYFAKLSDPPRPFILLPPLTKRLQFEPNDSLTFRVTLVGRAIKFLTYFIYTFQELGKSGIGKGYGKFTLMEVKRVSPLGVSAPDFVYYRSEERRGG